jgi:hypothetical protein
MAKKPTFTAAVLLAMGAAGTCMANQIPSESNVLDIPQPGTLEYAVASNSLDEDNIVLAAAKKKATKKKAYKKKAAKKKTAKK